MLRDAASLILFKKTDESLRVLMGLRNAGHKFMPNLMVFPGGGVDPDDHLAPAASPFPNHAMARLQRSCGPELATALLHAAARELEEETGLTLGTPPGFAGTRLSVPGRNAGEPADPLQRPLFCRRGKSGERHHSRLR